MSQNKAVAYVLLSGGADSTTCLHMALADGFEVRAISIDYGQRHKKELTFAAQSCKLLGVDHKVLEIPNLVPKTLLTDENQQVPDISYDEIKGISPSYVPFRNGLMMSMLASYVHGTLINEGKCGIDADDHVGVKVEHAIYMGAHSEDAKNWAYPDCTPEFLGAMANAIFIGTYQQVRLHTPLQWMHKDEIITKGDELQVRWDLTWSCYQGGEIHCGTCPTCRARKQAFKDAAIPDPTIYAA